MLAKVVRSATKAPRIAPSVATLAFLKRHRVPGKIIKKLEACSVSTVVPVGRLTLHPFSALPKENGKPNHLALENGFLVIGSGLSGDPIAVELSNGQVAFLSHDRLWEFDPDGMSFEDCVARSTLGIDDFWARALVEDDFPVDFYEAGGS